MNKNVTRLSALCLFIILISKSVFADGYISIFRNTLWGVSTEQIIEMAGHPYLIYNRVDHGTFISTRLIWINSEVNNSDVLRLAKQNGIQIGGSPGSSEGTDVCVVRGYIFKKLFEDISSKSLRALSP